MVLIHPHSSHSRVIGPSISAAPTEPILFAQFPSFDTMHDKLVSFVDRVPSGKFHQDQGRPGVGDISPVQTAPREIESSN